MINRLSLPERANYEERKQEVNDFNNSNAFRKRGLAIVPMTWFHSFEGLFRYTVQVRNIFVLAYPSH